MTKKYALLATICGCLLFTLTACPPSQVGDNSDSNADFYVQSAGRNAGYTPQGGGWKPNSKVEITLWGEPISKDEASTDWKHIFDVDVDVNSLFGYSSSSQFYPVSRKFCGSPVQGQTMTFLAKSLTTGRIRTFRAPVDLYYTFQPCR
jgi:hypothetical protein